MEVCKKCNNIGSTDERGYLDCIEPGCTAAEDRAALNKWLKEKGYAESTVREWAIYRYGIRHAIESLSQPVQQPAAGEIPIELELPAGDDRVARVVHQEVADGVRHVCIQVTPAAGVQPFQQRVQPWMMACFGAEISADKAERNHRFFEEATELVQALGMTASEAHQLVDYVYGRDIGEPAQEVGGVMVTLAALCLANDLDMHNAGEVELARIWTKVEVIRAKQAAKPKHSPLPEAASGVQGVPDDLFDLIREWAHLPEGQRGDAARNIIGCVNRSYSAGVTDGKALGALSVRQQDSGRDAALEEYGLYSELLRIQTAMEHMGDQLNNMDVVEEDDEKLVTPGFDALNRLLAAHPAPSSDAALVMLEAIRKALKAANENGGISDTIWMMGPDSETLFDFIDASIEHLAAHPANGAQAGDAMKWQLIDSAPKDGMTLLLGSFNSMGNWRTMRGQWFTQATIDDEWEDPDGFEGGWYETAVEPDAPNCWAIKPTHWQPLPVAPQKKEG